MAQFRDAYQQLTPDLMLLNTQGPGEASFEVYWTTNPSYQTAEVRFQMDATPAIVQSEKLENWQLDKDADTVIRIVSGKGFAADGWLPVPTVR